MSSELNISNFDSVKDYLIHQEGIPEAPRERTRHTAFRAASNTNALVTHVLFQGTPLATLGNLTPEKIRSINVSLIRGSLTPENREAAAKRLVKAYLQTRDQNVKVELRNLYERLFSQPPIAEGPPLRPLSPPRSSSPPQAAHTTTRLRTPRVPHISRDAPLPPVTLTREERRSGEIEIGRRRQLGRIQEGVEARSAPSRLPSTPTPPEAATAPTSTPTLFPASSPLPPIAAVRVPVVEPFQPAGSASSIRVPEATSPLSRTRLDKVYRHVEVLIGRTIPAVTGTVADKVNYIYNIIKSDIHSRDGVENKARRYEEYKEVIGQLYTVIDKDIDRVSDPEGKLRKGQEYQHIFEEFDRLADVVSLDDLSNTIASEIDNPPLYLQRVLSVAHLDPVHLLSLIDTARARASASDREYVLDLTESEVHSVISTIANAWLTGAYRANDELDNRVQKIIDNYNAIRTLDGLVPPEKLRIALHFGLNSPITDAELAAKVHHLHLQPR